MERPSQKTIVRPDGSLRVITVFSGDEKTQQQFKDQCDVNRIMKKYRDIGGSYSSLPDPQRGKFLDTTVIPNYEESLKIVIEAEKSFMSLPADIRKRFSNDPQELINFLQDPNNNDDAIKLGLRQKPTQPEPTQNQILNEILNETKKQNSSNKKPQSQAQE